ncbi:MAG: chemotaxis protein [candidate division Zixibacteria bacterium]
MKLEADSYLKSGSNEVRILEYRVGDACFGINILKVNKIISKVQLKTKTPHSHPAVMGIFEDSGRIVPIINLARFLGIDEKDENRNQKIIVTEFFEQSNGFLVDRVDWIHHFKWEDVIDSDGVMKNFDHRYVTGMVKPTEDHIVLLLDYETIILDLCPELHVEEKLKTAGLDINGEGRKILVAEDSSSVRAMLAAEFEEFGFEVIPVSDGVEALNTLKLDSEIDLVISDVEMPRMDGLALTCAIREGKAKCPSNLPVVVYSSIGDIGMKARAEFLQADAHVTKLNVEELMTRIGELIKAKDEGTLGTKKTIGDKTTKSKKKKKSSTEEEIVVEPVA